MENFTKNYMTFFLALVIIGLTWVGVFLTMFDSQVYVSLLEVVFAGYVVRTAVKKAADAYATKKNGG